MELNVISFSALFIYFITLIEQGFSQQQQPINPFLQPSGNQTGDPLRKCYVCNSKQDPFCSDEKWDKTMVALVPCSEYVKTSKSFLKGTVITHPFVCRKTVQRVTFSGVTDTRIVRSCGYTAPNKKSYEDEEDEDTKENRCYKRAGTYEVMVTYCTCTTEDGCNGGLQSIGQMELWIVLAGTLVSSLFATILS